MDKIRDVLLHPTMLRDAYNLMIDEQSRQDVQVTSQLAGLRREMADVERAIQNITNAIEAAGHSPALLQKLRKLEDSRSDLRKTIAAVKNENQKTPGATMPVLSDDELLAARRVPPSPPAAFIWIFSQ